MLLGQFAVMGSLTVASGALIGAGYLGRNACKNTSERLMQDYESGNAKISSVALAALCQLGKEISTLVVGLGANIFVPLTVLPIFCHAVYIITSNATAGVISMILPTLAMASMSGLVLTSILDLAARGIVTLSRKDLGTENSRVNKTVCAVVIVFTETLIALNNAATIGLMAAPTFISIGFIFPITLGVPILIVGGGLTVGYTIWSLFDSTQRINQS